MSASNKLFRKASKEILEALDGITDKNQLTKILEEAVDSRDVLVASRAILKGAEVSVKLYLQAEVSPSIASAIKNKLLKDNPSKTIGELITEYNASQSSQLRS